MNKCEWSRLRVGFCIFRRYLLRFGLSCATETRLVHRRIVFIHVVYKNIEIFAAMCSWRAMAEQSRW